MFSELQRKLRWWQVSLAAIFLAGIIAWISTLLLRKEWIQPVDISGYRFEPVREHLKVSELDPDGNFLSTLKILEEYAEFESDTIDEDELDSEWEAYLLALDEGEPLVSNYKILTQYILDRREYYERMMKYDTFIIGEMPDYSLFDDDLSISIMQEFFMEMCLYMELCGEKGDWSTVDKLIKLGFTISVNLHQRGYYIHRLIGYDLMENLISSMRQMDSTNDHEFDMLKTYKEGMVFYEKNAMSVAESMRYEFRYVMESIDYMYGEKYNTGIVRFLSSREKTVLNLKYAWKNLFDRIRSDKSPRSFYKSIDEVIPDTNELGLMDFLMIDDVIGGKICEMHFPQLVAEPNGVPRENRLLNINYAYFSLRKHINLAGKVPEEASEVGDDKLNELIADGFVYYTYEDEAKWFLTTFDPRGKSSEELKSWIWQKGFIPMDLIIEEK